MTETLEFRPAPPTWREILPAAFMGLLSVVLGAQVLRGLATPSLLGLTGAALLVAVGIWLMLRLRFPGSPRLRVDRDGMSYLRGRHERRLGWNEAAAILADFTRKEMRFVSASGQTPIVMHLDMVAADGRRFDMLIENYWQPPEPKVD